MGLSRQEYWRWLPGPPPGDLSNQGIKPGSPAPEWSPALQADASLCEPAGKPKPQHPYLKIHRGHNSYNASCQETRRNYTTPLILRGCSAKGSCYDHLYSLEKECREMTITAIISSLEIWSVSQCRHLTVFCGVHHVEQLLLILSSNSSNQPSIWVSRMSNHHSIHTMSLYQGLLLGPVSPFGDAFESVLVRWRNRGPVKQSEVSEAEKNKFSILMHTYGI